MRALVCAIAASALLAGCAAAPKKTAAPASHVAPVVITRANTVDAPSPRVSPYAPAQEDPSKRGNYVAGGLYAPGVADTVPDYIPDVDAIPEPEVREEPRARSGNRSYSVLGKQYAVLDRADGYAEEGMASYYGNKFHGRRTSSGEVYDMYAFSAAHRSLPLPSFARVTNLSNGKSVVVRVNDRGPFHSGRIIDLSYAAAVKLGYREHGVARVKVEAVLPNGKPNPRIDPVAERRTHDNTALDRLVQAMPAPASRPQTPLPTATPVDTRYRFDMMQNGKTMSADEFEDWMRTRRVRVATGKPGKPDAPAVTVLASAPPVAATASSNASAATSTSTPASNSSSTSAAPANQAPVVTTTPLPAPAVASPPPAPVTAAAVVAATTPAAGTLNLQVASFGNAQNAQHALSILQQAGIEGARVLEATVNGKPVWRLRIGPVAAAIAPELAARIAGLGFGQPQRVSD